MEALQPRPTFHLWSRLQSWEETWSLIPDKGLPEDDPDVIVKGGNTWAQFWRAPNTVLLGIMSSLVNLFLSTLHPRPQVGCTGNPVEEGHGHGCSRAEPGLCLPEIP